MITNAQKAKVADRIRENLITLLGGCCELCGTKERLEFNHIYERQWKARLIPRYNRMLRYRREAKAGLINLLCETCNKRYRPEFSMPATMPRNTPQ